MWIPLPVRRGIILGALLAAGLCSPGFGAQPGTLLELGDVEYTPFKELREDFKGRMQRDLAVRSADFQTLSPEVVFQQLLQEHVANMVPSRKLQYASVDARGKERTYSGRVFLPSREGGGAPMEVPLVIYQHATETRRKFSSYYQKGDETMLGALAAELCGFAVAMPDGDGMGADPSPEMHAYCHGKTAAACLIDMIRAVQGDLNGNRIFDNVNYVWDGQIFIMGYSEGGYIAMAAVKELSTNNAYQDIKLTGAACMAGPFNFAKATRDLLADAKTPYNRPYIPAYFLMAWQGLYPNDVVVKDACNPVLLKPGPTQLSADKGNVLEWLDGTRRGDQITPLIQARLTGKADQEVPARTILNEDWVKANVDNPASRLNQLFEANDLVKGWAPKVPVLLVHDPFETTVGFSNTQAIYDSWVQQGAKPIGIARMELSGRGPGHLGGALIAIPTAFIWIEAGMPNSILAMTKEKILAATIAMAPENLTENVDALAATVGLQDANENRALLPLSRIACPGARTYTVSFGDRIWKQGKVKLYKASSVPMFPGQAKIPASGGYTQFVKELKDMNDTFDIQPNQTYYMAVYPKHFVVALTLKFEARGPGSADTYTINLKQVKNKIAGRTTPTAFKESSNFARQVQEGSYEHPESPQSFITLP